MKMEKEGQGLKPKKGKGVKPHIERISGEGLQWPFFAIAEAARLAGLKKGDDGLAAQRR